MRRCILSLVVVTLGLALAAPIAAAPSRALTYEVTCGSDVSFVRSLGNPPGWPQGGSVGNTPNLFLGGHVYVYEDGVLTADFHNPPPPGLEGRLTTCVIVGPLEYAGVFGWVVDPAYILFTPNP